MKKLTAALFFYSLGMSLSAHAGVVMGGTRVVYLGKVRISGEILLG